MVWDLSKKKSSANFTAKKIIEPLPDKGLATARTEGVDRNASVAYNRNIDKRTLKRTPRSDIVPIQVVIMIPQATDDDFKDVFFSCIPILNVTSNNELNSSIRRHASELYDQETHTLKGLIAHDLSKENWIRRAQRMVILPDFDEEEKRVYISLRKLGKCSDKHEQVITMLATKLMSQAPADYPVSMTVVSSDNSLSTNPSPWMVYRNGQLVETDLANH